jgi:hypothetical protein
MPQITVYGTIEFETFQKLRQALDLLRLKERRRVNQRAFIGELVTHHIDQTLEELRREVQPEKGA